MAYGKGKRRETLKRIVDLGRSDLNVDLVELRQRYLAVSARMLEGVFPAHITDEAPSLKAVDDALLVIQKAVVAEGYLNSVWAEKARLSVKPAVIEQIKRGQRTLFGRFKNIATVGDIPDQNGRLRYVNLPKDWSDVISDVEMAALQVVAEGMDFKAVMAVFRGLRLGDMKLSPVQAGALRATMDLVQERYGRPQKNPDGVVQLHLDNRCFNGGPGALGRAREAITAGLRTQTPAAVSVAIASWKARGAAIPVGIHLSKAVAETMTDRKDQDLSSFVIEIGPEMLRVCGVVNRPKAEQSVVGARVVLGEDFGFAKTSSMVVVRSKTPIAPEAVAFVGEKPDKAAVRAHLSQHVSGDEIEVLERWQMDGRNFLHLIKSYADQVDVLRSEIDLCYNRLGRIRLALHALAGEEPGALVPVEPGVVTGSNSEQVRYLNMHGRFFRLLAGIAKLKEKRREVYRKVAAVKKNWLGHVGNVKVALAEKHGAVVVGEDLTVLAIPTDDPAYKGRTFNKMINNGAKGQYIRRSDNKMEWRGIASIRVPSYYSSTTDWRTGIVDKAQRRGAVFKAPDGTIWDADLHAGEMLARWLFLKPIAGEPSPAL